MSNKHGYTFENGRVMYNGVPIGVAGNHDNHIIHDGAKPSMKSYTNNYSLYSGYTPFGRTGVAGIPKSYSKYLKKK